MRNYLLILILSLSTSLTALSSKADTLTIKSESMKKEVKNVIIIPDDYDKNGDDYAVLYLLHGAGDDYSLWVRVFPSVLEFADQYNIIIVCPDGGSTSWYFDSPIDKEMQYETYVSVTVPTVERGFEEIVF